MDVIKSAYVRAYLKGIEGRYERAGEALDWLDGQQTLNQLEFAAGLNTEEQADAWARLTKQTQSLGPRAYSYKLAGIGKVNWGGDDPDGIDARLEAIDLDELAAQALKPLAGTGIAAMWPHLPEVGEPRIQLLGGYTEPLYPEDDAAGEPIGLYQVRADPSAPNKYLLRAYLFDEADRSVGTIIEWRAAAKPYEVGNNPTSVTEGASMPRFVMWDRSQDGTPLGEFTRALPLLKADVARQIEQLRVSSANVNPLKWAIGDWNFDQEVTAIDVLWARSEGASIGRLDPPTFDGLFALHDRLLARIENDLMLPLGTLSTGTFPSGEALDQFNAGHNRNTTRYANLLGRLLSDVVADFAVLIGIAREAAPPVSVTVNRDQMRRVITEQARTDFKDGLIPFRAAVIAISQYYPAWSDDEIEEFIEAGEAKRDPPAKPEPPKPQPPPPEAE